MTGRGLQLQAQVDPNVPMVHADEKMLTQVLSNLLTNAMNYTPGGGSVCIRTRALCPEYQNGHTNGHIQNGLHNGAAIAAKTDWVTISVSDNGPGITPDDLEHLFERFYRGEAGRKSSMPGTGLGLAICDEIVKRHRGRITVDSQVGAGSTFTVWLPAEPSLAVTLG